MTNADLTRAHCERWVTRRMNRRQVLVGGLTAAALTTATSLPGTPSRVLGQGTPEAAPVAAPIFSGNPFTLGVASGDPLPTGVVLWTRLAPEPVGGGGMDPMPYEVRWEIARDDAFGDVAQTGVTIASPALAHSVHVDVTGLEPATEYFYRFMVGGEESSVGRTKTAPALDAAVDQVRFALASCSHFEHGYFTAYGDLAAQDLDLVFHVGDYLYEYASQSTFLPSTHDPVRAHVGGKISTLPDYRNRHAQYKTDPNLQAAHAAAPWMVTWDDHETENNWANEFSEYDEPREYMIALREAAFQAYYEHMPLRPSSMPNGPDMQLYRRLTYGNLAEFTVLDGRQYRSKQPCGDGVVPRCPEALDPNLTMLGPDQERWVLEGLDASQVIWNIIAQQVMMAELNTNIEGGAAYPMDMWDGYPAARNRILQHIGSRGIDNAVVLTGDIHSSWVNDLTLDFANPNAATVATELVCTSITADNPFADVLGFLRAVNPHIKGYDGRHGYLLNEVTPDQWTATFRIVPDVTVEDATAETLMTWVIEAGQAGAVER